MRLQHNSKSLLKLYITINKIAQLIYLEENQTKNILINFLIAFEIVDHYPCLKILA